MDYPGRLQKLRARLLSLPCDAVSIENPVDILYLTGLRLSVGKLLVSAVSACLFVDGRYKEYCSRQNLYPVLPLTEQSFFDRIREEHLHRLGFDKDFASYQHFLRLAASGEDLVRSGYPFAIVPIDSIVRPLRLIKDPDEIRLLRAAAASGFEGYKTIVSLLKEGITERELAFEVEFSRKKAGVERLAFEPIIAFGAGSSMPHYKSGSTPLSVNTNVLIDIGFVLNDYNSDMTRTVFFGRPDEKLREIYEIVYEAKEKAFSLCRPGTLIEELDAIARDFIASRGYGEFFPHSLGHGVGLDIHESPLIKSKGPDSREPLQEGMVITVEPGIYLPGIGGVRLEDTVLVTKNGYENLTGVRDKSANIDPFAIL